jgi:hypothetical protein
LIEIFKYAEKKTTYIGDFYFCKKKNNTAKYPHPPIPLKKKLLLKPS